MNIPHTPEDAAILRRTHTSYTTQHCDFIDLCGMYSQVLARANGKHSQPVMQRCLAGLGYHGQEWLDLMDEMRGEA